MSRNAAATKDFFISYNNQDSDFAEWIAWQLENAGYSTIIRAWDFSAGSNYVSEMDSATQQAERTLIVLSHKFLQSDLAQAEWQTAFANDPAGKNRQLLPVRIDDVEPQGLLKRYSFIDLFGIEDEALMEQTLLDGVKQQRKKPLTKPPTPKPRAAKPAMPQPRHAVTLPDSPFQLPPQTEKFTGRAALVTQVVDWLQPRRVVTLWGEGGRGKTAIAWKTLADLQETGELSQRFPDGVIFHSYYGRPETYKALTHIAQSLLPGIDVRQPTSACQQALSGKRALLILDGAEDAAELRPILNMRGDCGVLITTRDRNQALQPDYTLAVDVLTDAEALALLQAWGKRYAEDAATGEQICALVGNLALAVRLAGIYMAQQQEPAADYLRWLQADLLDALNPLDAETRDKNVQRLLARSVAQVSEDAQTVLTLAGQLAFLPFGRHVITGALAWQTGRATRAVNQLANYGLLTKNVDGRLTITHALVYSFVQAASDENMLTALQALGDYYNRFARAERDKGLSGYRVLDGERTHIMALLQRLAAHTQWQQVNELVWAVQDYLGLLGYWVERVMALRVGVEAAHSLNDRYAEGAHLGHLGLAYSALGRVEEAIERYQQVLIIRRETGNRRSEGAWLGNLGNAYRDLGRVEEAIEHHQQALTISREIGDRRGEGADLGSLGLAYSDLGRVEEAIEHYQQALIIAREIGDRRNEGAWLGNLGIAYSDLGRVEEAIEHYQQALTISREIGDRRSEGAALGNLGLAYRDLGRVEEAIENYQQALTISREIGDRRGEGNHLGNLGLAYSALGRKEEAIENYQQALTISREIGDRRGEGNQLGNLGLAYSDLGRVEEAIENYQQVLTISREIGDRRSEGAALLTAISRPLGSNSMSPTQKRISSKTVPTTKGFSNPPTSARLRASSNGGITTLEVSESVSKSVTEPAFSPTATSLPSGEKASAVTADDIGTTSCDPSDRSTRASDPSESPTDASSAFGDTANAAPTPSASGDSNSGKLDTRVRTGRSILRVCSSVSASNTVRPSASKPTIRSSAHCTCDAPSPKRATRGPVCVSTRWSAPSDSGPSSRRKASAARSAPKIGFDSA